ncbi:unnamed protein product [Closterium sp. NIES-54]
MWMAGVDYSTALYIMHIVKGLPSGYNLMRRLMAMPDVRESLDKDTLISHIIKGEAMQEAEKPTELLPQGEAKQSRQQGQHGKPSGGGSGCGRSTKDVDHKKSSRDSGCNVLLAPEAGKDFKAVKATVQANPTVVLLDNGCSHHLLGTKEAFVDMAPSSDVKHVRRFNMALQTVEGHGTVALQGDAGKRILVLDILYVLGVQSNLLSAGQLQESGVKLQDDGDEMLLLLSVDKDLSQARYNGCVIGTDLHPCSTEPSLKSTKVVALRTIASSTKSTRDRWHARLVHIGVDTIKSSAKHEVATGLDIKPSTGADLPCVSCIGGKLAWHTFPDKGSDTEEALTVVHIDLCTQLLGAVDYATGDDDVPATDWQEARPYAGAGVGLHGAIHGPGAAVRWEVGDKGPVGASPRCVAGEQGLGGARLGRQQDGHVGGAHLLRDAIAGARTPIGPGPDGAGFCGAVCGQFLSPAAAPAPLLVPREVSQNCRVASDLLVHNRRHSPLLGSAVGGEVPLPFGLRSSVLRALLVARLSPACFPVRSAVWLPQVPPVASGRSALSAPLMPVERLERWPMDFLGALGRDCTTESDPAPRLLPPARLAASMPVAPPASADQIRRRFKDQQRELAPREGRSLPLGEPVRARSRDRRSHLHRSPAHRSSRHRLPARHASGYRSPAPRSPPPAKHQRLYSPRCGDRSPDRQLPSAMERVLKKLDGVEKALHRSHAGSSSQSAPPAAPVVPLTALLPHNPVGSPVCSDRPLPAGTGFVGAGGGDPWAQFVPPRPLPTPRDLAVSARRARTFAFPPLMKQVPTATLAHLWSLAECMLSL